MQKLAELCIKRPVFATMLILSLTVVGTFSFFSLGVDLLPRVDVPTVSISVTNPGASAEQIETEITKRIEDAVNTISGIDELRSTSSEGVSIVILSFLLEKNGDVAAQEVRDKVNLVVGQLPETALQPIIQKFDPDAAPIMQIAVAASRPLRDVTQLAKKQIKEQIENIPGVGQVQMVGGADRIHAWINPDKLRAYNSRSPKSPPPSANRTWTRLAAASAKGQRRPCAPWDGWRPLRRSTTWRSPFGAPMSSRSATSAGPRTARKNCSAFPS
jgi:HAE1 family hydrophobic/amphiphilic exporter-1